MSKPRSIVYRSAKYGFTLQVPRWWKPYVTVKTLRRKGETESEYHFRFKFKGKVYDDIFTPLVYRMTRQEWERDYADSPLVYLAEHEGRVFAYLTPEEPLEAFLDKKTGDYDYKRFGTAIGPLKRMVNRDVPRIVTTLRFHRKSISRRPAPYRSRKVRGRR
ncbi:hypothetical protein LJK88_45065 [Paenibacillus sp. P26]|nr:hypothetical protein LJK88_45065 [Paenibacillus sp. P26]